MRAKKSATYSLSEAEDPRLAADFDKSKIKIIDEYSPQVVIDAALNEGYQHVCCSAHPFFLENLNLAVAIQKDKEIFKKFPLSTILSPKLVEDEVEKKLIMLSQEFTAANEKNNLLNDIENVLKNKNTSKTLCDEILTIADELFTNAVYNAPFVDFENKRPGAERDSKTVRMDAGKHGRMFLGCDEDRIVIGCEDDYGSLNLPNLFKRIQKCYNEGVADNIRMTKFGAGIGSFFIFNSAMSYVAEVETGTKTLICCVLPLSASGKVRRAMPKNLHMIIKNKGE